MDRVWIHPCCLHEYELSGYKMSLVKEKKIPEVGLQIIYIK